METIEFLHTNPLLVDDVEASIRLTTLLIYMSRAIMFPKINFWQVVNQLSDLISRYCDKFIRLADKIPDKAVAKNLLTIVKQQVS
jgi:hypothetical protein